MGWATNTAGNLVRTRLVVSIRTVDHVSAILARLRLPTRRDAGARAAGFEGGPSSV